MVKLMLKKYPAVAVAMKKRHEVYNSTLDELHSLKEDENTFVLQPSKTIKISRTEKDPEVLKAMYQLGRQDAMENLDAMRKFINKQAVV